MNTFVNMRCSNTYLLYFSSNDLICSNHYITYTYIYYFLSVFLGTFYVFEDISRGQLQLIGYVEREKLCSALIVFLESSLDSWDCWV